MNADTNSLLVQLQQAFPPLSLRGIHSFQLDDLAHDLTVETGRFGLAQELPDIGPKRGSLIFQTFNLLNEQLQLSGRGAVEIRHKSLPLRNTRRARSQILGIRDERTINALTEGRAVYRIE